MNQTLRVNKTNFHMKGFAPGLALKQRWRATRKSPVGSQPVLRNLRWSHRMHQSDSWKRYHNFKNNNFWDAFSSFHLLLLPSPPGTVSNIFQSVDLLGSRQFRQPLLVQLVSFVFLVQVTTSECCTNTKRILHTGVGLQHKALVSMVY